MFLGHLTVKEDWPSRVETRNVVIGMLRTVVKVEKLTFVRRTYISFNERSFLAYVTDTLQAVNDCYVLELLENGQIELPGVLIEMFESYEAMEQGGLVVSGT